MKNSILTCVMAAALLTGCCCGPKEYASYEDYPIYQGDDLELTYTPSQSDFKVWAPTAQQVMLRLYENGQEGVAFDSMEMKCSSQGTWIASVKTDLQGKFYTFRVLYKGQWLKETPGIWAKAVGVNGERGAVIDFASTNPQGWELDQRPELKSFNDIVLYEMHHRDFSISATSGIQNRGKYLALTEEGTKTPQGLASGIDHLKELGVTHVHLLPSYDFGSIDESRPQDSVYNWGYDPKNYNVPEGSYSTNPADPASRVKEFKQMVQALHKNGLRVVMDVVYNHVYSAQDSPFERMVPGYFFRHNQDGTFSNSSGCGNETASEREMMRNYIVESVKYWVNEYHIDGFRFDLMGIHDIETMNLVKAELAKIDPTIFVYGEGWTAHDSPLPMEKRSVKQNARDLKGVAVFSDDIRDGFRGSWSNHTEGAFASGLPGWEESIRFGVAGATSHPQIDYSKVKYVQAPYANESSQVINYISAHDDRVIADLLTHNAPKGSSIKDIVAFEQLAMTGIFTAQGVPFFFNGDEFFRTRKGVHNTYNLPDSINAIDWNNKAKYQSLFDYYKGLISIRKGHPAFKMNDTLAIQKHLVFLPVESAVSNFVAYQLKDNAAGDSYKNIVVLLNGNRKEISYTLEPGKWNIWVEKGVVYSEPFRQLPASTVKVPASSAMVLFEL